MSKTPYVHNSTDELAAMQFLARGSNAAVFHTIGLLLPTQTEGASEEDITKYTGLSSETIRKTLANLLTSGLILQVPSGNYTTAKFIEFRSPTLPDSTKKLFLEHGDQSINLQSSTPINNPSLSDDSQFTTAIQALNNALIGRGGGLNGTTLLAFKELWTDYPNGELHARALVITLENADKPNYYYYEKVVKSGAKGVGKETHEAIPAPVVRTAVFANPLEF